MPTTVRLPDFNGGFITKSIEGKRIVTRDAFGNITADEPINLIRKGMRTNFGVVSEYNSKTVTIKNEKGIVKADRHLFNSNLHKSIEVKIAESNFKEGGTLPTPIGNVYVDNLTDNVRQMLINPDKIVHHTTESIFQKSIGNILYKAVVIEPLFKNAFLKSVTIEDKKNTDNRPKLLKLIKATATSLDSSAVQNGVGWNVKGGQKPTHKYLERKPNPSGDGYIYLYELPNGKKEWKDKEGNAVDDKQADQKYEVDYKVGEAVKFGSKYGRIKDVSDNFLAIDVEGKIEVINKAEHVKRLDEQKKYFEGAEIDYKKGKAKILKLTDTLALIKELNSNKLTVINIERPLSRTTDEEKQRNERKSINDKYSHVYQGYAEEDYYYNLDYDKQPEYQAFLSTAEEQGFGRIDDLTYQKFVRVGNETNSVQWRYNPELKEVEFLLNGTPDFAVYYNNKKYLVRDLTTEGYSLEDPETQEAGLFLSHEEFNKQYGTGDKPKSINIKPEYTEEQKARFAGIKIPGIKKKKIIDEKIIADQIKAENEKKQQEIKKKLSTAEYYAFANAVEERGYQLSENKFIAKKNIEIEGKKFKLTKRFEGDTQIEGPYSKLKVDDNSFEITDITTDGVFYTDNNKEIFSSFDELRVKNGKNIFEPTVDSKGVISKLPSTKIYFGMDDKNAVSAHYEIIEADDLTTSHTATGEANPNYLIGNAQNRDRSTSQSRAQIEKIANSPNFDFLSDDRTAQNGAPVVNNDYNAIAGNGRGIGIKEHYGLGKEEYLFQLLNHAERLGFNKDDITKFKNPVLVRKVNVDLKEAQRLGAISNQDQKLALEERETAKGMATRIDDRTFNKISGMFANAKGEFNSITEYLDVIGEDLVRDLIKKEIIPQNEAHLFFDMDSGRLNAGHKDKLKQLLTQSILGDASQAFENVPDAARQGISKALGDVFALKGKDGDITPHISEAVKLLSKYEAMKESFKGPDDFLSQAANDAFEPLSADKKMLAIFDLLTSTKPNEIKDKIRDYRLSMEGDMFSDGLEPEAAFDKAFEPKYPKGINKSIISRIRTKAKFLLKSFNKKYLDEGTAIEAEHEDLYNELAERLAEENVKMPISKKEFFKWIAKTHLNETEDYYKLLKRYIEKSINTSKNVLMPSKKNPLIKRWQKVAVEDKKQNAETDNRTEVKEPEKHISFESKYSMSNEPKPGDVREVDGKQMKLNEKFEWEITASKENKPQTPEEINQVASREELRRNPYYNHTAIAQKNTAKILYDKLEQKGFIPSSPQTSITDYGVSTYITIYKNLIPYKFRISDHPVENRYRVQEEIHLDSNASEKSVDNAILALETRIDTEERRKDLIKKQLESYEEKRAIYDRKWNSIKNNFDNLGFYKMEGTYQNIEDFKKKHTTAKFIFQKDLGRYLGGDKFYYEWADKPNGYETKKPSDLYIDDYINKNAVSSEEPTANIIESKSQLPKAEPRKNVDEIGSESPEGRTEINKQTDNKQEKIESYPKELSKDEMMEFIENNKLKDSFGEIDYQGAKDIVGGADRFVLKEIPIDKFDWYVEPRKRKNNLPVIALDLGDGDYEILDGKHRIGEAKARGEKTIIAYVGVDDNKEQIYSENFKKWFGDWENDPANASKVVDKEGKPLVVYHGTDANFSVFDSNLGGEASRSEDSKRGFFFTDNSKSAEVFAENASNKEREKLYEQLHEAKNAKKDPMEIAKIQWQLQDIKPSETYNIMPIFLSILNPVIIDAKNKEYGLIADKIKNEIEEAKARGNDGVVIKNIYDEKIKSNQYIAFSSSQIKSAIGNNGNFDGGNPDITKSTNNKTLV